MTRKKNNNALSRLTPFDVADYLDNVELIRFFIVDALESGEPDHIAQAMTTVARARGIGKLARAAGMSVDRVRDALVGDGAASLVSLVRIVDAWGLRLVAVPITKPPSRKRRTKRRASKASKYRRSA